MIGVIELVRDGVTPVGRIRHRRKGQGDSWFAPIACSADEGIVAPGNDDERAPKCPACWGVSQ